MIGSYTKLYNLGDRRLLDLFKDPLVVQEKIDGSQFSFLLDDAGQLHFRSKKVEVFEDAAGMFELGCKAVRARISKLRPNLVYRGEFLRLPKHNTLAYDRIPDGHIMLWDVQPAKQFYITDPEELAILASEAGFESVPLMYAGMVSGPEQIDEFMQRTSVLGGSKVEGVVLKNYHRMNEDGKLLGGKFVSERFKEVNNVDFKGRNPGGGDMIQTLMMKYRCEARWDKAVQHLRDSGQLTSSPRDIGSLMKEVQQDIREECADEIKDLLFKWAWKKMARGTTAGLPEWYKKRLMKEGFDE